MTLFALLNLGTPPVSKSLPRLAHEVPGAPGAFVLRSSDSRFIDHLFVFEIATPTVPETLHGLLQSHPGCTIVVARHSKPLSPETTNDWAKGQAATSLTGWLGEQRAIALQEHQPALRDVRNYLLVRFKEGFGEGQELADVLHAMGQHIFNGLHHAGGLRPLAASLAEVQSLLDVMLVKSREYGAYNSRPVFWSGALALRTTLATTWDRAGSRLKGESWNWVAVSEQEQAGPKPGVLSRATRTGPPKLKLLVAGYNNFEEDGAVSNSIAFHESWLQNGVDMERGRVPAAWGAKASSEDTLVDADRAWGLLARQSREISSPVRDGIPLVTLANTLVGFDPFRGFRGSGPYNTVVIGDSGSGKTRVAKDLARSAIARGGRARIMGSEREYQQFCDALGGTVVHVGEPGMSLNLLALASSDEEDRIELLTYSLRMWVSDIVGVSIAVSEFDRGLIEHAIHKAWEKHGSDWTLDAIGAILREAANERCKVLAQALSDSLAIPDFREHFTGALVTADGPLVFYADSMGDSTLRELVGASILLLENHRTRKSRQISRPTQLVLDDVAITRKVDPVEQASMNVALRAARKYNTSIAVCMTSTQFCSRVYQQRTYHDYIRQYVLLTSSMMMHNQLDKCFELSREEWERYCSMASFSKMSCHALIVNADSEHAFVQWPLSAPELALYGGTEAYQIKWNLGLNPEAELKKVMETWRANAGAESQE